LQCQEKIAFVIDKGYSLTEKKLENTHNIKNKNHTTMENNLDQTVQIHHHYDSPLEAYPSSI